MKKSMILAVAMLFSCVAAFAQPQLVQDKDFEKFSTVKVEDKFIIRLVKAEHYGVKLITDERIAAHVQSYVKNGTLYLALDEKGYTPELKKELKQKGAAEPVLEAEIYMPELNHLILTEKVKLVGSDDIYSENFTLTMDGSVVVSQINVTCSTAEVNVSKGVQFNGTFNVASKLYLNASNASKVSLTQKGGNAFLNVSGNALVDMKADLQTLEVNAASGSESHISGVASLVKVTAAGMSRTDAELLEAKDGEAVLSGSAKCHFNVTEKIKVNLTGGSMLTFKRAPYIEVDRIVNSTLIKADDPKRK